MFEVRQRELVNKNTRPAFEDSSPDPRNTLVLLLVAWTPSIKDCCPDGEVSTHASGIQCSTSGANIHCPMIFHCTVLTSARLMAESGSNAHDACMLAVRRSERRVVDERMFFGLLGERAVGFKP